MDKGKGGSSTQNNPRDRLKPFFFSFSRNRKRIFGFFSFSVETETETEIFGQVLQNEVIQSLKIVGNLCIHNTHMCTFKI